MAALQYVDVPGYAGLLIRQTMRDADNPQSILFRARQWLGPWMEAGRVHWWGKQNAFVFQTHGEPAILQFGYLKNVGDKYQYDSAEFQFCVASHQRIKTPNGPKRIDEIAIGDEVLTLEGTRKVTKVWHVGKRHSCRIQTHGGEAIVSRTHRVLTANAWACPEVLRPILARKVSPSYARLPQSSQVCGTLCESISQDPMTSHAQTQLCHPVTPHGVIDASLEGDRNDCVAFVDALQEYERPEVWYSPVMLHGPIPRQSWPDDVLAFLFGADDRVDAVLRDAGYPGDCRAYLDSHDGLSREASGGDRERIPSPGDVDELRRFLMREGDRDNIQTHSQERFELSHPYSSRLLDVCEEHHRASARMALGGEVDMMDLTVEGASHYILENHIIASNCGFDELTHFYQEDYEYLFSRLRKPSSGELSKVPIRMRSASNPGAKGHFWVKDRFQIERIQGRFAPNGRPLYAGTNPRRPHVPSYIDDNPFIDQEGYRSALRQIDDPVTREQKESGDWGITQDGRFRRSWIRRYEFQANGRYINVDGVPILLADAQEILVVDPASSSKDNPGKEELTKKLASWTVVSRWLVTKDSKLCLMNVRRHQGEMPEIIKSIKAEMTATVRVVCMEYTTQSIHLFQQCKSYGFPMRAMTTGGRDKVSRATDATIRMENGQIFFPPSGPRWLQDYEDELFSWTGHPEECDDQVDVTSYAGIYVTQNAVSVTSKPRLVGGR